MVVEQSKRAEASSVDPTQVIVPDVIVPRQSSEEKALAKQQARAQEAMTTRLEEEEMEVKDKLDREARKEEDEQKKRIASKKEQALHEKRQKLAAVLAARTDINDEERKQVRDRYMTSVFVYKIVVLARGNAPEGAGRVGASS